MSRVIHSLYCQCIPCDQKRKPDYDSTAWLPLQTLNPQTGTYAICSCDPCVEDVFVEYERRKPQINSLTAKACQDEAQLNACLHLELPVVWIGYFNHLFASLCVVTGSPWYLKPYDEKDPPSGSRLWEATVKARVRFTCPVLNEILSRIYKELKYSIEPSSVQLAHEKISQPIKPVVVQGLQKKQKQTEKTSLSSANKEPPALKNLEIPHSQDARISESNRLRSSPRSKKLDVYASEEEDIDTASEVLAQKVRSLADDTDGDKSTKSDLYSSVIKCPLIKLQPAQRISSPMQRMGSPNSHGLGVVTQSSRNRGC
ncbi:unnamed protein product [Calicophoron daubneyi]|uniref:Uncharacterized protein n=1 Tax=Calicophoron daubneyi TaxID=300641 RepID=A0AAV2T0P6_CALDB